MDRAHQRFFQPSQPAVTPQQRQQGRTYDSPIPVQSPSLDAGWQTNNSHRFFTASEMKQRGAFSMGAISNHRPLDERLRTPVRGGGTKFNRKALIGALRGGEMNPEHAEQFAQIAAMLASSDDSPEHDTEQEESDEAE